MVTIQFSTASAVEIDENAGSVRFFVQLLDVSEPTAAEIWVQPNTVQETALGNIPTVLSSSVCNTIFIIPVASWSPAMLMYLN